ncbi:MAG TPA: ABC transporter ATP-binding protein [Burkholderiales bacterium]|nr:ABC transporter ATP-binding protein [Burkholderiales bacterium]
MTLSVEGVDCYYGSVKVLKRVSLRVAPGEVLALLGRNGAGKTTTLKAIMRLVACRRGTIRLGEADLTRQPAHTVASLGVGYVPQGRRLFSEMTVEENLRMGLLAGKEQVDVEEIYALFPVLRERLRQVAGTLSGGQQQMLAMGRALCLRPKVMLLDEPCEGLQPTFVQKVLETVKHLRARGVAVLLVEQKVEAAMQVADRIAFLENGALAHEMPAAELGRDRALFERYVGVRRA